MLDTGDNSAKGRLVIAAAKPGPLSTTDISISLRSLLVARGGRSRAQYAGSGGDVPTNSASLAWGSTGGSGAPAGTD